METIQAHEVTDAVHLPGFEPYNRLPSYYGLADAFVHASTREEWGLVVNEAMASGLPVIVSERCGCAPELVDEDENGYTFDPFDTEALTKYLLKVSQEAGERKRMGKISRKRIEKFAPPAFGAGIKCAAEAALKRGSTSPSIIDELLIRGLIYR
jgi:glycosyltransferase involved in cell wall biosynthesis